jgi:1-acyl-sn-glycerol-3-phosphate acyltransferase
LHPGADRHAAPSKRQVALPQVSPVWLGLFRWYARRFVSRHFHTVRLAGHTAVREDLPLVLYANHASWWDPMMLMLLQQRMAPGRTHYAPVDARAIERYAMFKRMGFFGVEQQHARGAVQFLRTSQAILNQPGTALWITPQGRFADVRERPLHFHRGLGALAARSRRTLFLPIALEYTFWEERLPEALVWMGQPTVVERGEEFDEGTWTRLFERELLGLQERLAVAVMRRRSEDFQVILKGARGVTRAYDTWRALVARLRGRPFQKEHGTL